MGDIRAVIFDLGGVVLDSPFAQFYLLEEKLGFERHTLSKVCIISSEACFRVNTNLIFVHLFPHHILQLLVFAGPTGPFERLERGEIDPETFKRLFEQGSLVLSDVKFPQNLQILLSRSKSVYFFLSIKFALLRYVSERQCRYLACVSDHFPGNSLMYRLSKAWIIR